MYLKVVVAASSLFLSNRKSFTTTGSSHFISQITSLLSHHQLLGKLLLISSALTFSLAHNPPSRYTHVQFM